MAAPLRVLFAPAAGPEIGGGHVMRGLALAEALRGRGAECLFAVPAWGASLLHRFATPSPAIHPLDRAGDPRAIAHAVRTLAPDVLVLDDYSLDAAGTEAIARSGLVRVVIDDLADRTYACDLLVDPGFGREASDYDGRLPEGAQVLAGPGYALLREAFAPGSAGAPLPIATSLRTLFVSFGLADPGAVTARVVERLHARAPGLRLDVALAGDALSLPRLRALAAHDANLRLHVDARDVAALMRSADAAVGGGGSSTWERCALGLPTLAVVVADNQRAMIRRLAAYGAVLAVDTAAPDFPASFDAALDRLADRQVRGCLREASYGLCDGLGAGRVADAIFRSMAKAG